jgi:hypothetical protein
MGWWSDFKAGRDARRAVEVNVSETVAAMREAAKESMAEAKAEGIEKASREMGQRHSKKVLAEAEKKFAKETEKAFKPSLATRIGQEGLWEVTKGGMKKAGIVALAVGGVAALGIAANSMRKSRRPERGATHAAMDRELEMLQAQQQLMLESGPQAGRGEYDWRNRVRGGAVQGPDQPALTAVSSESVQNLGNGR